MKSSIKNILSVALILGTALVAKSQIPSPAPAQEKAILLIGGTVHVGNGQVIENAAIGFDKGVITYVGKTSEAGDNFKNYEQVRVEGKQIYPGLIIMNSQIGLVESSGVKQTVDNREMGDMNPSVRTAFAYNSESQIIPVARANGVLLGQIAPEGGMISGSSSVMNFDAWTWKDAIYKKDEGIWLNWPNMYSRGGRVSASPSQTLEVDEKYQENVRKLESIFSESKVYKGTPVNSKLAAMKGLFDGSVTLYINADYVKTILESISFAKKQGIQKIVLASADEDAWMVKDFLKENNIPVIVSQIHRLPKRKDSYTRAPFELAALFTKAGITTALTYDNETGSMNLPFEAGQGVPYGLTKEEALQTVTLNPAKILGIDKEAGSIEVGKDAHLVVSDGDLLDMRTNWVKLAYINGRKIDLDNKHKTLYRKFAQKYGQEIVE